MNTDSDIPQIELPKDGFKSSIPDILLEGKTNSEKFLLTEIGKVSSFIEWAGPVLVDSNRQARRTNGRLLKAEDTLVEQGVLMKGFVSDIETVRTAKRVVRSKYFWAGLAAFLFIGVPFLSVHAPGAKAFYGFLTSLIGL